MRGQGWDEVFILKSDAAKARAELGNEEKFCFPRCGPYFVVAAAEDRCRG